MWEIERKYQILRKAFLEVLDNGNHDEENLRKLTGLSEIRCRELEELYNELSDEDNWPSLA